MSIEKKHSHLAALTTAAIGIVYGDIGTSPLYTLKSVFAAEYGLRLTEFNIVGVISLILWGLMTIVTLKYITLVLRADNRGEGGIMALMALALDSIKPQSRAFFPLVLAGVFGTAMFYGDSVITPANTVLSAIEGIVIATPRFKPFVVPVTVLVLLGLYLLQSRGTAGIARWFGPIMVFWFGVLAVIGVINILKAPQILSALNPLCAVRFMLANHFIAFASLGAVVLAFTGAEALYADMGHFGKTPIRVAWISVVFPALALNYMGQGGLLLTHPDAIANPFFLQLGAWSIYPLVALAAVAAVIASQATISGTFSMTKEAIALGFLPRMRIQHTSESIEGQIYIPLVNWLQFLLVVVAVIGFGSSDSLTAAYGIAVTATMLATTVLTFFVIRHRWNLNAVLCLAATGFFIAIDVVLLASCSLKVVNGGWFPLLLGAILLTVMLTWKRGRELVFENLQKHAIDLDGFLQSLFLDPPKRVAGTALFLRGESDGVPHAMLHNLAHNKVVHERVVFFTARTVPQPYADAHDQIQIIALGYECYQLRVHYGFRDEPDLPRILAACGPLGLPFDLMATSFFIARQTVIATPGTGMVPWREHLFVAMSRNARDAADYYRIPTNRVIELGTQVEI